jgi:gamma-glutamyltranspeptidase/glutathione hydrolase
MRNFMSPGRSVAYATRGMVATSHPLASSTALDTLRNGGNAVDAGIAACAVLAVCEPHQTGIGGDCFALYSPSDTHHIHGYNGSGRLPELFNASTLRAGGATTIPTNSALSVTIPGAIEAWKRLSEKFGTLPFGDLLQPAIELAEQGMPIHERFSFDIGVHVEKVRTSTALSLLFLDNGKPKAPGNLYRNVALANTLRGIASNGIESFYRGKTARALVSALKSHGGHHTEDDFSDHFGEFVTPVRANYRDFEIIQCPPNSQGMITLMILRLLANLPLDKEGPLGPWRYHSLMEASRIAFGCRDAYMGDPAVGGQDFHPFLSEDFIRRKSATIRHDARLPDPISVEMPNHRDTAYLAVVDKERNALSLINSLFDSFGSGILDAETGVLFHNRATSFSLVEGHPNEAKPGKRPMHTIIPGLARKNGQTAMAFGVMGGHFQPVGHAFLLSNIADYGLGLQESIELPRCFPQDGKVWVERWLPDNVRSHLTSLGHSLAERVEPAGGAQLVWIDTENGVLAGASDSRKDGCAIGY